ncbi:MAG: hypothetical protein RL346_2202 [Verrucomicrobiota bacterium]
MLKIMHLAGVFVLFASLGATLLGGTHQKSTSILHGISMLLILVAGFALLKKPPMGEYWWMAKFGLWVFIGIAPLLAKKNILPSCVVFLLTLAAAIAAAYLAFYRPF